MILASAFGVFFIAGIAGGITLGLIGVGMALIAVPVLTSTLPVFGVGPAMAPLTALATSMAIVSIGALSSIASHHRLGNVNWPLVWIIVPGSVVGVSAGSVVASHLPGAMLRWIFAAFLIFTVSRMLWPKRPSQTDTAPVTGPWHYRAVGAAIGAIGSVIGAGGGGLMVPFLSGRGQPMIRAIATSTTISLPVSVLGAIVYASLPTPNHTPWMVGYVYLPALIGMSIGSVLTAPLGARIGSRIPPKLLKNIFAGVLVVFAIKMVVVG